jgi:hypothetical protein
MGAHPGSTGRSPKLAVRSVWTPKPNWKGLRNVAGPARNKEMVKAGADLCIALHRTLETSKGTKDCARQAIAAGIPTYLIENDDGLPTRLEAEDGRLR